MRNTTLWKRANAGLAVLNPLHPPSSRDGRNFLEPLFPFNSILRVMITYQSDDCLGTRKLQLLKMAKVQATIPSKRLDPDVAICSTPQAWSLRSGSYPLPFLGYHGFNNMQITLFLWLIYNNYFLLLSSTYHPSGFIAFLTRTRGNYQQCGTIKIIMEMVHYTRLQLKTIGSNNEAIQNFSFDCNKNVSHEYVLIQILSVYLLSIDMSYGVQKSEKQLFRQGPISLLE